MGHRRLGTLPKSKRWRDIVAGITAQADNLDAAGVAATMLQGVESRFQQLAADRSVEASFKYLIAVAVAARSDDFLRELRAAGVPAPEHQATPLALTRSLGAWVDAHPGSMEYGGLSKAAAADALAAWYAATESHTAKLFEKSDAPGTRWSDLGTGAGFCEVSRLYFASLTERYLRYFVDREISAEAKSVAARDELDRRFHSTLDDISRHAFETAKITQSFSAGWFNKHTKEGLPTDRQIRSFFSTQLAKLRSELRQEGLK